MTMDQVHAMLQWTTLINIILLLVWFVGFVAARGFIYRLHNRWFSIPEAQFDAIHYTGMMLFKMMVLVFNIAPLLALYILR